LLGYPDVALADADCALNDAREIGHAATLMYALNHAAMFAHIHCGNYKEAKAELDELVALANEKEPHSGRPSQRSTKVYYWPWTATCRTRSKCSPPEWPHTNQQVDPLTWLADVLARIADIPQSQLHELPPWN
jgi:hypothetical protein